MDNVFEIARSNPLFQKFEVSSVLFTEYRCLKEESVFHAWSHLNYFVYTLSGKKRWNTLGHSYMVHAREALFVKKGANIIHKFFEEDFCALLVFIPDAFVKDLLRQHPASLSVKDVKKQDSVMPLRLDDALHNYFQSLYSYFYQSNRPNGLLLEVKFKELLLHLLTSSSNPDMGRYLCQVAREVKPAIPAIMEANFTYPLSLHEFARLSQRSLSSFKRDFRKYYKTTPGRWLTQKRLERAAHFLKNTDQKVFEVAFECGFENASHFGRVFKEKTGVSPLQFRGAGV